MPCHCNARSSTPTVLALVAAACFFAAGVVSILRYVLVPAPDLDDRMSNGKYLREPGDLKEIWAFRRQIFGWVLVVDVLEGVGLLCLIGVGAALKNMHKGLPGLTPKVMMFCFFLAGFLPFLEFFQNLGTFGTADWISTWDNVDEHLPALEISFLLSESRAIWVISMQFIFVGFAFVCVSLLTLARKKLPVWHMVLGFIIGLFSFLVFLFELVAFSDIRTFGAALGIVYFVWASLLLPCYLIATGVALRNWKPTIYQTYAQREAQLNPMPTDDDDDDDSSSSGAAGAKAASSSDDGGAAAAAAAAAPQERRRRHRRRRRPKTGTVAADDGGVELDDQASASSSD